MRKKNVNTNLCWKNTKYENTKKALEEKYKKGVVNIKIYKKTLISNMYIFTSCFLYRVDIDIGIEFN